MAKKNWGGCNPVEMMPFKKYAQSKGLVYSEDTIWIQGTFKDKETGEKSSEVFKAHKVSPDVKVTYKTYLDWFNYTICDEYTHEREFVKVKQVKEPVEEGDD